MQPVQIGHALAAHKLRSGISDRTARDLDRMMELILPEVVYLQVQSLIVTRLQIGIRIGRVRIKRQAVVGNAVGIYDTRIYHLIYDHV